MVAVVAGTSAAEDFPGLDLTNEEEVLLRCIHAEASPASRRRIGDLVTAGNLKWDVFWVLAAEQRVLPAAASSLSALNVDLPKEQSEVAHVSRWRTFSSNLLFRTEIENIANTLHARSIPVVPLKGAHLVDRVYAHLGERDANDIDVLVPETRLPDAQAELKALGYSPTRALTPDMAVLPFHAVPMVRATTLFTFVVELHWNLSDPRFVTVDYPALWERVLTRSPDEATLRPLPGEELLVFLALHLHKHHSGRLRLLVDVDRLVRREGGALDWTYVSWLARRWSAATLLYFALSHARRLLATPVDEEVLNSVRPATWRRSLVNVLAGPRAMLRPPSSEHLRYNRFRLAYCAMLQPFDRALTAYLHYLFPWPQPRHRMALGSAVDVCRRITRGIGRTGQVVASCLNDP